MRGNSGSAPLKVLDEKGLASGGKRWRFIPLNQRLKDTSARPAALPSIDFEANLNDVAPDDTSFSHFAKTLSAEAETNITQTFKDYHQTVHPLSLSLPLLYRNRRKLFDATTRSLQVSSSKGGEATSAIANCLAALSRDLGPKRFYSFFPQLVSAIADVFESDRAERSGEHASGGRSSHSILWDPETAIVPLFAALAEITKSHLQQLASNPRTTVVDLLPLLANRNRRVREMAAEACLGYLLRKTRDLAVLKRLTTSLLEASISPEASNFEGDFVTDGLGASLFEAVRVPGGRLHTRAGDVIRCGIQALGINMEKCDAVRIREETLLSVLAAGLKSVSRHLSHEEDSRMLCSLLVMQGGVAARDGNSWQLGGTLLLLRNWFRSGGTRLYRRIGPTYVHRALSFLNECVNAFPNHAQVVYESLGAMLLLSEYANPNGRESVRPLSVAIRALAVSSETSAEAITAALNVLLLTHGSEWTATTLQALVKDFAALLGRLAEELGPASSSRALQATLMFFEIFRKVVGSGTSFDEFHVPFVEDYVRDVLSRYSRVSCNSTKNGESLSNNAIVSNALEYLCSIPVGKICETLEELLQACMSWRSSRFPRLLMAIIKQLKGMSDVSEAEGLSRHRLKQKTLEVVRAVLFEMEFKCEALLRALKMFVCSFPEDVLAMLTKEQMKLEPVFRSLFESFSFKDVGVRLSSSSLLLSLSLMSSNGTRPEVEPDVESIDGIILRLRAEFEGSEEGLKGLSATCARLLRVPTSLQEIASNQRLLHELVRLVRSRAPDNNVQICLVHISIGLLRTPLQVLWESAGELWCALACLNSGVAMEHAFSYLKECEAELLHPVMAEDAADSGDVMYRDSAGNTKTKKQAISFGAQSKQNEHANSVSDDENDGDNGRSAKRRRVQSLQHVSTRPLKSNESSAWDVGERNTYDITSSSVEKGCTAQPSLRPTGEEEGTTDWLTAASQIIKVLSKEPQHTLKYRSRLITSYLALDPGSMTGKKRLHLALNFTMLLERMGGLKCCETNVGLERAMRTRLLLDISKPFIPLQTSALRCLSLSRFPHLKPYRDSFIRLIDDKTFREELAMLTDTLFRHYTNSLETVQVTQEESELCDVLTRICFSKMRGKQSKVEPKRFAVMSFLVSKVPWSAAMPKITSLALASMEEVTVSVEKSDGVGYDDIHRLPKPSVQRGILASIDGIIKHGRRAVPSSSWRQICVAIFLFVKGSGRGAAGQNIRSPCLHLLAEMHRVRPDETAFIARKVLEAMRDSDFDVTDNSRRIGSPALLHYIETVFSSKSPSCQALVMREHEWAVKYCVWMIRAVNADVQAVHLALSIANGVAVAVSDLPLLRVPSDSLTCRNDSFASLVDSIGAAVKDMLGWMMDQLESNKGSQKLWFPIFSKALELISTLAGLEYLTQSTLLSLAEGLCVLLESPDVSPRSAPDALNALRGIAARLREVPSEETSCESGEKAVGACVQRMLPLLTRATVVEDSQTYIALCELIALATAPDLAAMSPILKELNAVESAKLNVPDLDARIDGLQTVTAMFKDAVGNLDTPLEAIAGTVAVRGGEEPGELSGKLICGPDAVTALFYGCLSATRTDDSAVRGTAGYSLVLITKWVGLSKQDCALTCRKRMFSTLLSTVASSRHLVLRREYCRAFGELIRGTERSGTSSCFDAACDEQDLLCLFKDLSSSDPESDFFENVVHLQPHRRGRALRQLQKYTSCGAVHSLDDDERAAAPVTALASTFSIPLGMNMALETAEGKESRRYGVYQKHQDSREGAQQDVSIWAIELVGASAKTLPWETYKDFLSSLLRRLRRNASSDSTVVLQKLLVTTANAFPLLSESRSPGEEEGTGFLVNKVIPDMLSHVNPRALEGNILAQGPNRGAGSTKSRTSGEPNHFHAHIAVAVGRLMTRLPRNCLDSQIPLLVAPLSGALRSRLSGPRQDAKNALTSVVLTLGPKYLGYVLSQVLRALDEGYRKDGCVHVVYAVLHGIREYKNKQVALDKDFSFAVDGACDLIVKSLCEELEGGVGESRHEFADPNVSSARERQTSLRATKVIECAELLAEQVSFQDNATGVCKPFLALLSRRNSAKLASRIQMTLQRVILGFSRNSTMSVEYAFKLCYTLINPQESGDAGSAASLANGTALVKDDTVQVHGYSGLPSIGFGLQLLNMIMAKNFSVLMENDERGRSLQAMCDPFLPLVVRYLEAGQDDVALTAFRVTQRLLKLPLSNKPLIAGKLSDTVVQVLSQGAGGVSSSAHVSPADDLFNTCLRAAAVLLHEVGTKGFTIVPKERIDALVNISCSCIEFGSADSRSAALALLRAVVSRRIIMPCVYDAMEKVNRMAVHAQSSSMRKSCITMSVAFLVSFPLGSKRVRQHLEFFVRNLSYSAANGRLASLQALRAVISKFPEDVLAEESEYLFVALSALAARDDDAECKACAHQSLRDLFGKIPSGRQLLELLRMAALLAGVKWSSNVADASLEYCESSDALVQRSGIAGLTAACESGRMTSTQLILISSTTVRVLKELEWAGSFETTYALLHCIESCVGAQGESENVVEVHDKMMWLWQQLPVLLLHKHQWVRLSGARLLGRHLSACGGRDARAGEACDGDGVIWSCNNLVRATVKAVCLQLEASHVSGELGEQCVKNLLCMADVVRKHPSAGCAREGIEEEQEDEVEETKTADGTGGDGKKVGVGRTVRWVVSRMSGMAGKGGREEADLLRRACALRVLLVTAKWWGSDVVRAMSKAYISAIVRVLESGEGGAEVEEDGMGGEGLTWGSLQRLAQMVQGAVLECMEEEEYYGRYREIAGSRQAMKQKRKREDKLAAAMDPERAAKRRRAKTQKRRQKQKTEKGRRGGGSGGVRSGGRTSGLTDEL